MTRRGLRVVEARYVQEIRRPDNNPVGGSLSRTKDEHYVAGSDADELTGSATCTNFRRFTVNADDALWKSPLQ